MASQLVIFAGEQVPRVVMRRRLRVNWEAETAPAGKIIDLMLALKESLAIPQPVDECRHEKR